MSQVIKNLASGPVPPTVPTQFTTDSGIAIPAANNINVVTPGSGTQGIATSGSGSTITITLTDQTLKGTATTTGNSTANINVTIPLPLSNSAVSIRANLAGYDVTANLATGGELIGTVRNVGGVLTVVNVDTTENDDPAIHDTTWTLVISGTNVLVQVTGTTNAGNADVIHWTAVIDYVITS